MSGGQRVGGGADCEKTVTIWKDGAGILGVHIV